MPGPPPPPTASTTLFSLPQAVASFSPAEPVDVVVQEQMGIALFDEDMVETIIDVRDRCLKPGGKILPARFELYLEPVQLLAQERVPMIWELPICGFTLPPPLTGSPQGCFREIARRQIDFLLCEPSPAFAFDLTVLTREELPRRFSVRKPVKRPGQLDGICMYFRAASTTRLRFRQAPMRSRPIGRCFSTGRRRKLIDRAKSLRSRSGFPISPTTSNGHGISAEAGGTDKGAERLCARQNVAFRDPTTRLLQASTPGGRTREAVEIEAVPVANFELKRRVRIEAERQGGTPIRIIVAALARDRPIGGRTCR